MVVWVFGLAPLIGRLTAFSLFRFLGSWFCRGLRSVLSLPRSPRWAFPDLSDCRRGARQSSWSVSELRPLSYPLPGGMAFTRRHAADPRSTCAVWRGRHRIRPMPGSAGAASALARETADDSRRRGAASHRPFGLEPVAVLVASEADVSLHPRTSSRAPSPMPRLCGFGADRLGPSGPATTGQPCSPRLRQWSEVRFQQDPVRLSATRQPLRGRRHGRLGGSAPRLFRRFGRGRFHVRRFSRWFPGLGVAASVLRRKSIDQTVIYISMDVGVVKLLSELGFLGSGGFLGFCC